MSITRELSPNELVETYLHAEQDAEEHLDRLCRTVIYPLALPVVRAKLTRSSSDVDDVVQGVVLRLASDLRRMHEAGGHRLANVVGWVIASAINGCHDHFRETNRPRTQLANAVRYILAHSIVFRVWPQDGRKVCGWRRCIGKPPLSLGRFATLMQQPAVVERARRLDINNARSVRRVLARVFALACGSIDYRPLVPAIVEASGLPGTLMADGAAIPEPVAGTSADEPLIQRRLLHFVWTVTMGLPREQRLALLLHLSGRDGIHAFWEGGAVPKGMVAEALTLDEEALGSLPWSDLQIAGFIDRGLPPEAQQPGVRSTGDRETKRQQQRVINWRRDARRVLDEQLRTYGLGSPPDNFRPPSTSTVQDS
jgi:hypothetical protein